MACSHSRVPFHQKEDRRSLRTENFYFFGLGAVVHKGLSKFQEKKDKRTGSRE